jgi:hypothetical protein
MAAKFPDDAVPTADSEVVVVDDDDDDNGDNDGDKLTGCCKCNDCTAESDYLEEQEEKLRADRIFARQKKNVQRLKFNYIERRDISNSHVGVKKFLVNSLLNPDCSFESVIDEGLRKLKLDANGDVCAELFFEHLDEEVLDREQKKDKGNFWANLEALDQYESIESYKRSVELYAVRMKQQDEYFVPEPPSLCPYGCKCKQCCDDFDTLIELDRMEEYSPPPEKDCILLRYKILQADREDRLIKKRKIRLQNVKKRERLTKSKKKK